MWLQENQILELLKNQMIPITSIIGDNVSIILIDRAFLIYVT